MSGATTETTLWSIDTHGHTLRSAAQLFACSWFADEPRKATRFQHEHKACADKAATFGLVDGVATYRVRLVPGRRNVSRDTYEITRLS